MKIFLGANDLQQTLRDWGDLLTSKSFSELEQWILSMEREWGCCYIFVETTVPRGSQSLSHNNQFDLLICFDTRIAICEMKRFSDLDALKLKLKHTLNQINGQLRWMQNLLHSAKYDDNGLCSNLLCPFLNFSQLEIIRKRMRDLHSAWHIWAIGIHSDMQGKNDDEMPTRAYYITEALRQRLTARSSQLSTQQIPLSIFIQTNLTRVGAKLLEFDSFETANTYLHGVAPAHRRFVWDSCFVNGLYSDAVETVSQMLRSQNVVEIIGPPGAGKSTLIKEVIELLDEDSVELSVRQISSRSDLIHLAHRFLRGEPAFGITENELLQSLAEEPTLFWIREYDRVSVPALLDFFANLQGASGFRARWIIESTDHLSAPNHLHWEMLPLNSSAVSRIIEKLKTGGFFKDPEQVIELAQGNPRRAVRLWRSRNEDDADSSDEVEWFYRQLSNEERQMLPAVCHAISNSPLGVTLALLIRWAAVVFPDRSTATCEKAIYSLLHKLEVQRLARVSRFNSLTFGEYLSVILPENLQITVLDYLAPDILNSINLAAVEKRLGSHDALHESLLESGTGDSLGFIASALLQGDIEPFYRSSFRATQLLVVPDWFDRTDRILTDSSQIYLLRALRAMMQVGHRPDLSVEKDLGLPSSGNALQQYVFAVTQARIAAYHKVPDNFRYERAVEDAKNKTDPDLRCEILLSIARSLQHTQRFEESWRILYILPNLCPPDSPSRFLAHGGILEFLNRKQQRERVISNSEAYDLILTSAREVCRYAARVENLQAICDGLFFFVRAQDLVQTALSDAAVEDYSVALEFVEQNRRRRARRLQVLLSHGSLHRHACRRDNITWEEFRRHMDLAFIWYGRALKSANAQNHLQHKLNALTYMTDFCLKSQRFVGCGPTVLTVTVENTLDVLQKLRANPPEIPPVTDSAISIHKQNLFRTLNENIPFLMYIEALGNSGQSSDCIANLQRNWSRLAVHVNEHFRKTKPYLRTKYSGPLWKRIERMIRFGNIYSPSTNRSAVINITSPLFAILDATKPPEGPNSRAWQHVHKLISEYSTETTKPNFS